MSNEHDNAAAINVELEHAMTRALEQAPEPVIPADFAARVAAKARTLPQPKPAVATQYGRKTAFAAALVLTVLLFVLAPHALPGSNGLGFALEMVLFAELGGLAIWLTRSHRESL
ncbi:MAG TPA: hypothetical protein VGN16_12035 [Acidobacteriaceae bacterium]|jgi:hypothetical protein